MYTDSKFFEDAGSIYIGIQVDNTTLANKFLVKKDDLFIQIRERHDLNITNRMEFIGKDGQPITRDKEDTLNLKDFEDGDILYIKTNNEFTFINIKINDEPIKVQLPKIYSFRDVRNELKKYNDIYINEFMQFFYDGGLIPRDNESSFTLLNFKADDTLIIKDPMDPDCNLLIQEFELKHGLRKNFKPSLEDAIEFKCKYKGKNQKCKCVVRCKEYRAYNKENEKYLDITDGKQFLFKGNAEVSGLNIQSKVGVSYKSKNEINELISTLHQYHTVFYIEAELEIDNPKLTDNLLEKVNEILIFDNEIEKLRNKINDKKGNNNEYLQDLENVSNLNERYKKEIRDFIKKLKEDSENDHSNLESLEKIVKDDLDNIYKTFGQFYKKKLFFGGKLTRTNINNSLMNNESRSRQVDFGGEINVDGNGIECSVQKLNELEEINQQKTEKEKFYAKGGNRNIYNDDDQRAWIDSLSDWKNWAVIDYVAEPIFNLLNEEQRNQIIKKIIGKRILEKGIIHIERSNIGPYHSHNLSKKINECLKKKKDRQIFVSIISKKRKDVYSVRVVRNTKTNEHTLLIHCIEGNKREIELRVRWIIIGYPDSFNYVEPEFNHSRIESINNYLISTGHLGYLIPIENLDNYFPLITCVQDVESSDKFEMANIAIGINFLQTKALIFAYNTELCKTCEIDKNFKAKFSINYSTIPDYNNYLQPISWKKRHWNWTNLNFKSKDVFYKEKNNKIEGKKRGKDGKEKLVCIYNEKGFVSYDSKSLGFRYLKCSDKKGKLD
ncbi:26304_t:CDS:2, partial [Dentiscutata erythropus]